MSEKISSAVFLELLQDAFERGQELTFTPTGNSMRPMLDGVADRVRLGVKPPRLRRYDVAFYLRPSTGQPVLHRMVGLDHNGDYIFSGDGQYYYEYGIKDDNVVAVMTAFTRGGRERRVTDPSYRLYIRCMMLRKRLHIFAAKMYHKLLKRQ